MSFLPFAYLPQHVWEVAASVIAILIAGHGLYWLTRSQEVRKRERLNRRTVKAIGLAQVLLGLGIGIAAFTADAEAPGGSHDASGWGGAFWIAFLCVWVVLMCAWLVFSMVKARRDK
jgi:cytochrome bd-type quinol oxidase subunit 2